MRTLLLISLSALALATGCNQVTVNESKADPDKVVSEIRAAEAAQMAAFEKKDLAGATAIYAAEATLLVPGKAPAGGEMITKHFEGMLADPAFKLEPAEDGGNAWVSASGDLAATTFVATHTETGPDGKVGTHKLLNQTVWKKQDDGSWKIVSDVNAAYPDETAAPAAAE